MQETREAAKAELIRAKDRMARALSKTPDDKIHWSPSETARTPVHQVAHAALAITGMQDWFSGKPFPFASMAELDSASRTNEKAYSTREEVLTLLEDNSTSYMAWIDSLSDETLASMFESPMGSFPMASAITFPADHIRAHTAQIDYIQTIYGDHEW